MVNFGNNSNKNESQLGHSGEFSDKFQRIGTSILYGYLDYLTTTSRVLNGEDTTADGDLNPSCKYPIGKDCEWYSSCFSPATENCPFIIDTMKKKCNEFKVLDSSLSNLAQKWSSNVRACLQRRLASETLSNGSVTCKRATFDFFDFHSNCYFKGPISFCELSFNEQLKIALSGADMLFSRHTLDIIKIGNEIRKYCY